MGLKQAVEDHIVLFILGTLAAGFVSGWSAFSAIQVASGRTSISIDRLRQLEAPNTQDKKALIARVQELELERADLQKRLLSNRPSTGNYARGVIVSPPSPAELKIGTPIKVKFDYVLAQGQSAMAWATAEGSAHFTHSGSGLLTGSGTEERHITGGSAGTVTTIAISISATNGEVLYRMTLPVEYVFK